jgi:hypothetical protein
LTCSILPAAAGFGHVKSCAATVIEVRVVAFSSFVVGVPIALHAPSR